MCYSISIILDYKNNNSISYYNELLQNIASNIDNATIYKDYELNGTNNFVKDNTCSTIIEIDNDDENSNITNIINIIELILPIKELSIEYIYHNNNILFCSKKYLNNLNKNLHNKKDITNKIEENKKNNNYEKIYKSLKLYKSLK
jgi:hypothetical protein